MCWSVVLFKYHIGHIESMIIGDASDSDNLLLSVLCWFCWFGWWCPRIIGVGDGAVPGIVGSGVLNGGIGFGAGLGVGAGSGMCAGSAHSSLSSMSLSFG